MKDDVNRTLLKITFGLKRAQIIHGDSLGFFYYSSTSWQCYIAKYP